MKTIMIITVLLPILGIAHWPTSQYVASDNIDVLPLEFSYPENIEWCSNLIHTNVAKFYYECDVEATQDYLLNIKKWLE